jgi:hypothetical protein
VLHYNYLKKIALSMFLGVDCLKFCGEERVFRGWEGVTEEHAPYMWVGCWEYAGGRVWDRGKRRKSFEGLFIL